MNYSYNGNRLSQIIDNVGGSHDVDFVQRGGANYTFYDDGSLKSDANEQIQNINYDTFLQQPTQVQLTDGRTINHYYDGGGKLLKTVYSTGETWEFGNGLIYKNSQPYQLSMPEGRAIYNAPSGGWGLEFQYQDHLGNTRVSFKANGNQLEKVAETAFDPWGLVLNGLGQQNAFQNRFEFLNREKESTFGLNTIRLGARGYNPTTGRFDRIDPLAEKREWVSPYNYALNNPLNRIDPNGALDDWVQDANGNIHWDNNANSQATTKPSETYLGRNLTFTFNSYINNTFDGPRPPWDVTGDKLTSIITINSNERADGSLQSVDVKSITDIKKTAGFSLFK